VSDSGLVDDSADDLVFACFVIVQDCCALAESCEHSELGMLQGLLGLARSRRRE